MSIEYKVWEYIIVFVIAFIAYVVGYRKGHLHCYLDIHKWRTEAVPTIEEWKRKNLHNQYELTKKEREQ